MIDDRLGNGDARLPRVHCLLFNRAVRLLLRQSAILNQQTFRAVNHAHIRQLLLQLRFSAQTVISRFRSTAA